MSRTTPAQHPHPSQPARSKTPWWKRPWIVPLWAVCAVFIVWRVPNYLGFTPDNAIVELRSGAHYLLLSGHVIFGAAALVCCCLQLWPWLRRHHPAVHRISGRIYVLAVLPGSVLAAVSSMMASVPLPGRIGNTMLSVLWLGVTVVGFYMIRQRRFEAHRRWMIRSFALCFSIVVNRLWIGIWLVALMPFFDGYYGGDETAFAHDVAVASIWCSWVVNLLIAEWWIERTRDRSPLSKSPTIVSAGNAKP